MLRVIVAVVLAAVVQFAWGFAYYGPLRSLDHVTSRAPDDTAVTEGLKGVLPESGTYIIPMCPGSNASEEVNAAFEKRHTEGPLVQIHYRKAGFALADMPVLMGTGFGHTVVTCLLVAFLLRMVSGSLETYGARVLFVFGLGVFAALTTRISDAIWFHHHWAFILGQVVYSVVAWLFAGVVMGALIRSADQQALATKPHHPSMAA